MTTTTPKRPKNSEDRPRPNLTPIIEVHGWEHQHSEHDFTGYTISAEWTHSTTTPWGSANISLKFPVWAWEELQRKAYVKDELDLTGQNYITGDSPSVATRAGEFTPYRLGVSMPFAGDFLVIRDPTARRALWWGPIQNVSFEAANVGEGALQTVSFSIRATSWFAKLAECQVATGIALDPSIDYGSLISSDRLDEILDVIGDAMSGKPGDAFMQMWQFLRGYKIPVSLGGEASFHGGRMQGEHRNAKFPSPGSYLCNNIPVVWNRQRSFHFSRGRIVERVPGAGNFNALGAGQSMMGSQTSILAMIMQTFQVNRDMVEIFPSLEYPGSGTALSDADFQSSAVEQISDEEVLDDDGNVYTFGSFQFAPDAPIATRFPFPYAPPEDVGATKDQKTDLDKLQDTLSALGAQPPETDPYEFISGTKHFGASKPEGMNAKKFIKDRFSWVESLGGDLVSPLAKALRMNPVIIYRMTPLRTQPMSWITSTFSEREPPIEIVPSMFPGITWYTARTADQMTSDLKHVVDGEEVTRQPEYIVHASEVERISASRDDKNLFNAITMDPSYGSNPGLRFWQDAQLPLVEPEGLRRHGSRILTAEWSILPRKLEDAPQEPILAYIRTITALAYHINAPKFWSMEGTASIAYRPDIKHGEPVRIFLPPSWPVARTADGWSFRDQAMSSGNLKPKGADEEESNLGKPVEGAPYISAYVHTVTHSCIVGQNGEIRMRTQLQYKQGFHDERARDVRPISLV